MNTKNHDSSFWKSRSGIAIQIVIVLLPSALFLKAGSLLLVGVLLSVLLSWIALKLQQQSWGNVGLKKPDNFKKIFLVAVVATIILIPFSFVLRHLVTSIIHQKPDLSAFADVKGNPTALFLGLLVAWIFGALCEELLFRGFLMNNFFKLFRGSNDRLKWTASLLLTSILVGLGHAYQGTTGMILTAVIAFCLGLIYLSNKKNLWPSILTHGLYDSVAFLFIYYGFSLDKLFK